MRTTEELLLLRRLNAAIRAAVPTALDAMPATCDHDTLLAQVFRLGVSQMEYEAMRVILSALDDDTGPVHQAADAGDKAREDAALDRIMADVVCCPELDANTAACLCGARQVPQDRSAPGTPHGPTHPTPTPHAAPTPVPAVILGQGTSRTEWPR